MKVLIVGLGLIGGSVAKALSAYTDLKVVGMDKNDASLALALDEKSIAYIAGEQDLMDAEKTYNTAMQSLNDYLLEPTVVKTSDTTVTSNDSVNTGVETKAFVPMMASMLAALGVIGVVNKKRKEED